jgi:hypothetical protein
MQIPQQDFICFTSTLHNKRSQHANSSISGLTRLRKEDAIFKPGKLIPRSGRRRKNVCSFKSLQSIRFVCYWVLTREGKEKRGKEIN